MQLIVDKDDYNFFTVKSGLKWPAQEVDLAIWEYDRANWERRLL